MNRAEFELHFNGQSDDGVNYGCGMRFTGEPELIGRMLAEYCIGQLERGQPSPIQILISAFDNMNRMKGGGRIINPFSN